MKLNGRSNQSKHITMRKKLFEPTKIIGTSMGLLDLHDDKNQRKKETDELFLC